ncbi:G3E family GTPase [Clostridium saccharoperbutylacetonicum]|uniref:Putative GTPase n=1 Tax=Clostridium saccharoperbutylacetonicum N1-4(HMT) TaxID=931276 RepID=M1N0P4_9CLOT|nr:GTP-binding protein [Clostridium saccharoperbutylacetonicum]AGF57127.1 putative GTPase [Clostridium saccharoperbutylacetonicum N1-4(HMT)]NRT62114.1 G3E family GTPase [Clostridium saccharoperbutylacetonicum]NSB25444.1 G3E family GTPase [Clostridium saccharoperbutylacetonicum]NSB44814.1 G3E family GTPase [Clostridium saccharoperbutylacetonicum]
MKIHIELVTGFLGAGKTSFINSILSESIVEGERILVLQLEHGKKEIKLANNNNSFIVHKLYDIDELKEKLISLIRQYNPNRIIVEYNGTIKFNTILDVLNEKVYKECCKITTVFFVADGITLKQFIDNLGSFIVPFIQNANMIVVNNTDYCRKELLDQNINKIRNINPRAYILKVNNKYSVKSTLKEAKVLDNGYLKKLRIKVVNHFKTY